jgi:hypothetical protein
MSQVFRQLFLVKRHLVSNILVDYLDRLSDYFNNQLFKGKYMDIMFACNYWSI